jgi:acetylornithine/succinyldiaminopimelate/putrescine aminotransferase
MEGFQGIRSANVREVRGLGLMVAIELKGRAAPHLAALADRGVLALTAGTNAMRFLPPLVIDSQDINTLVQQVTAVLEE